VRGGWMAAVASLRRPTAGTSAPTHALYGAGVDTDMVASAERTAALGRLRAIMGGACSAFQPLLLALALDAEVGDSPRAKPGDPDVLAALLARSVGPLLDLL
jgi:hypothetical protein